MGTPLFCIPKLPKLPGGQGWGEGAHFWASCTSGVKGRLLTMTSPPETSGTCRRLRGRILIGSLIN